MTTRRGPPKADDHPWSVSAERSDLTDRRRVSRAGGPWPSGRARVGWTAAAFAERVSVGVPRGRIVRPIRRGDVDHCMEEGCRERGADQLYNDVAGHPSPGKSPRRAKAMLTAGLRWAPETLPMNKMIDMTIKPGATTAAVRLIVSGTA
jgi:hypothetical protein